MENRKTRRSKKHLERGKNNKPRNLGRGNNSHVLSTDNTITQSNVESSLLEEKGDLSSQRGPSSLGRKIIFWLENSSVLRKAEILVDSLTPVDNETKKIALLRRLVNLKKSIILRLEKGAS